MCNSYLSIVDNVFPYISKKINIRSLICSKVIVEQSRKISVSNKQVPPITFVQRLILLQFLKCCYSKKKKN